MSTQTGWAGAGVAEVTEDHRRHRDAKALRQALDKLEQQRRKEAREALEKWAASPPPPVNDEGPVYRP